MYDICYRGKKGGNYHFDSPHIVEEFKCERCAKDSRFPHCDKMSNVNKICVLADAVDICPMHKKDMKIFVKILFLEDEPFKCLGNPSSGHSSRAWHWWSFVVCEDCFDGLIKHQPYIMGRNEWELYDDKQICHFPYSDFLENDNQNNYVCYLDSLQQQHLRDFLKEKQLEEY